MSVHTLLWLLGIALVALCGLYPPLAGALAVLVEAGATVALHGLSAVLQQPALVGALALAVAARMVFGRRA